MITGLALWPTDETRHAGKELLASSDVAHRLWLRASALLGNPDYMDSAGDISPLPKPLSDDEDVRLIPVGMPNPKALEALKQAETQLAEALDRFPNAGAEEREMALRVMARIKALKGFYYRMEAQVTRARMPDREASDPAGGQPGVYQAITLATVLAETAYRQGRLVVAYEAVALADAATLASMEAQTDADQREVAAQIEQHDRDIAAREMTIVSYRSQIADLEAQALDLRTASIGAPTAPEMKVLANQSLEAKAKAHELSNLVTEETRQIELVAEQRADLAIRRDTGQQHLAVIRSALAEHEVGTEAYRQQAETAREDLAATLAALRDGIATATELAQQASEQEALAAESYGEALTSLESADQLTGDRLPGALSDEADVRMHLAAIFIGQVQLQKRMDRFAGHVKWCYNSLPESIRRSEGEPSAPAYLTDRSKAGTLARQELSLAAELYQQAADQAESAHRWVYQGQVAAAYFGMYQLSGSVDDLADAEEAQENAVAGREGSGLVAPIVKMTAVAPAE